MGKIEKSGEKKSKKKVIIIAIIVSLLMVIGVLGFVIYSLLHKEKTPEPRRDVSEGLIVDADEINKKASEARFTTDMNMIWTFPSGSKVSNNAEIGNSASNQYECYFEVYLDNEDQTLLYSSPVLPVGKRLEKLELDQTLPDGTYDAVCTYHVLDDENPEVELGAVSFAVTLMFVR